MAINFRKIFEGLNLVPKSSSTASAAGDVDFDTSSNKFNAHNGSSSSPLVTEAHSATLSNKNLQDSTTAVVDNSDPTKQIKFDAGGTTGTSTTITAAQTGDRVLTLPDVTDNLVSRTSTDTLSNKTLNNTNAITVQDSNLTIQDNGDNTKQAKFDLSPIATGTTRTLTVPNADMTLVGLDTAQVLQNKTINNTNTATLQDTNFTLQDNSDNTKQLQFQLTGITTGQTRTITVPDASTTMVGTDTTQTLSNKTLSSPELDTALIDDGIDLIEESSISSPSAGRRRLALKTDGKLYLRDSSGNEKAIAMGNQAGINYILNPDAEADTAGWATYADAAQATPVDGTGGSPNVTFTRSTTTPLRGLGSFLFTKDAANRQGQGASYDFTIDDADKAKVLNISFDYEIGSGTYADGDLTVYLYDVTNSLVIQPAGYTISNVGIESKHIATFQTSSSSTSYRLILHVASTSASAYTVKLDNVIVGPSIIVNGTPVTDWTSFTPTGSWVSNTTYTGRWRRVGDSLQMAVRVSMGGAPNATALTINLPAGMTIDNSKRPENSFYDATISPTILRRNSPGATFYGATAPNSTTSVAVYYLDDTATAVERFGLVTQAAPWTVASGDEFIVTIQVPIVGWSSNVQMSSDTDTRIVAFSARKSSAQSIPNGSTTQVTGWETPLVDTHGAFNTSTGDYTVKVPGKYQVVGNITFTANATGSRACVIRKNGVVQIYAFQQTVTDGNPSSAVSSCIIDCVTGDVLTIGAFQASGGSLNTNADANSNMFSIERLAGPALVAATEVVAFNARGATPTGTLGAAYNTVIYGTVASDTHNAYNSSTGVYTCPVAGFYNVAAGFALAGTFGSGAFEVIRITKNGSAVAAGSYTHNGSNITLARGRTVAINALQCNAGDTIEIKSYSDATSPAYSTTVSGENFFSITRSR